MSAAPSPTAWSSMPMAALSQFKALNTPGDPSRGFLDCLEKVAQAVGMSGRDFVGAISVVIHGTTLATNALLTGRGAKVGMLTTEGFRDELECRRGFKNIHTSMYNLVVPPYRPLVRRHLRLPVGERTLHTGEVKTPVAAAGVRTALDRFAAEKVEAVAICFLHAYANPENEQAAAALCRERFDGQVYVTSSHEILPVSGEFERFSTTVVSAYLGPIVSQYFTTLEQRLSAMGFKGSLLTMRSDGLVQSAAHSRREAVTVLNSGPAAAPIAAAFFGRLLGHDNVISVDMGGTSLDVGLIWNGQIPTTTESWVGDERVATKMVEAQTIGAGGGSLAWIDSLGLLRVGPQSASSDPGTGLLWAWRRQSDRHRCRRAVGIHPHRPFPRRPDQARCRTRPPGHAKGGEALADDRNPGGAGNLRGRELVDGRPSDRTVY